MAIYNLEKVLTSDSIFTRLDMDQEALANRFNSWTLSLKSSMRSSDHGKHNSLLMSLKETAKMNHERDLDLRVKYAFYAHLMGDKVTSAVRKNQERLADLRYPSEWFPATRAFQREFHVHVGPTNSGKTYHALQRLERAETGVYAGPLRLLAHEVYMRLNAKGHRCSLITGDERRAADDNPEAPKLSCTVEMVPLSIPFEVAVIDEIQMLGSEDRGWAWTQALLGVIAKEVHLCGEERAVPLIQELAASCGEKVHIHRYERLSPLKTSSKSLRSNLKALQKGDCVVAFSIVVLHSLRQSIEKALNKKCAIIYGSLPPETRTQQAKLFNDPDNDYDILVASNAVGMGLNLSIKRLVFQSLHRNIQGRIEPIPVPEIKQIAGRAGRYSTAAADMKQHQPSVGVRADELTTFIDTQSKSTPDLSPSAPTDKAGRKQVGFVTTLEDYDHAVLTRAMQANPSPLKTAGVFAPAFIIERFARYYPPNTPFSFLLTQIRDMATTSSRTHVCDIRGNLSIADSIESVRGLTINDRLLFSASPIEPRKAGEPELARAYATAVAQCQGKTVLDYDELDIELLEERYKPTRTYLARLEGLHKGVIIFLWLSFRFTGIFLERELANHVKELVEKRIENTLAQLSFDYDRLRRKREMTIRSLLGQAEPGEQEIGDNDPASGTTQSAVRVQDPVLNEDIQPFVPVEQQGQDDPLLNGSALDDPSFFEGDARPYDPLESSRVALPGQGDLREELDEKEYDDDEDKDENEDNDAAAHEDEDEDEDKQKQQASNDNNGGGNLDERFRGKKDGQSRSARVQLEEKDSSKPRTVRHVALNQGSVERANRVMP